MCNVFHPIADSILVSKILFVVYIFNRDGWIVIFCRIQYSVNRRLISGWFLIRIFDITFPLVYTYKNYSKKSRPVLDFSVIFNLQ